MPVSTFFDIWLGMKILYIKNLVVKQKGKTDIKMRNIKFQSSKNQNLKSKKITR